MHRHSTAVGFYLRALKQKSRQLPFATSVSLSRWSRSRVDLKSVAKGGPPHFAWYYLAPRVISLVLPLLLTFPSFYSPYTSPTLFCFSLTSMRTVALYSFMKSCAQLKLAECSWLWFLCSLFLTVFTIKSRYFYKWLMCDIFLIALYFSKRRKKTIFL